MIKLFSLVHIILSKYEVKQINIYLIKVFSARVSNFSVTHFIWTENLENLHWLQQKFYSRILFILMIDIKDVVKSSSLVPERMSETTEGRITDGETGIVQTIRFSGVEDWKFIHSNG